MTLIVIILSLVPKLVPFISRNQNEGSYFQVFCTVEEGTPPLFYEWAKNGKIIKSSPDVNYKIENSDMFSTLSIKKLSRSDTGNYTCSVKNSFGSDSKSFVLSIKGKTNI